MGLCWPIVASPERPIARSASRSSSQRPSENPSPKKNTALKRPTGCDGDSKYSRTLESGTTARSAFGSSTTDLYDARVSLARIFGVRSRALTPCARASRYERRPSSRRREDTRDGGLVERGWAHTLPTGSTDHEPDRAPSRRERVRLRCLGAR